MVGLSDGFRGLSPLDPLFSALPGYFVSPCDCSSLAASHSLRGRCDSRQARSLSGLRPYRFARMVFSLQKLARALTLFVVLLFTSSPLAQSAPDVISFFNNSQHGLGYYSNVSGEEKTQNSLRTANATLHNDLYLKNYSNNEFKKESLRFNAEYRGLPAHSATNSLYTTLNARTSKTVFMRNYINAFEHYVNVLAGPNNNNHTDIVNALQRIRFTTWQLGGWRASPPELAAYWVGTNAFVTKRFMNNHTANEAAAIENIPGLTAAQNSAHTAQNRYVVIANAYRQLEMYRGRINSQDGSVATPAIAAYEPVAARNTAVFLTGGLVGAYAAGRTAAGNNITNAIFATVVAGAKENNAEIAATSHDLENRLHNISRARFAANDTANNAYKAALNTVANTAAVNFSGRDASTPLTTAENALKTAYEAWNRNDTSRNNAVLQGNLSNLAKQHAASANPDLGNAVNNLFNVELAAVAASVTADSEFTGLEIAFTSALNNLVVLAGYKGSEASRNAAYALRAIADSLNLTTVQAALSSAAFTAFNTAHVASSEAVEAAAARVAAWQQPSSPLWALQAQFAAATLVLQRNITDAEQGIVTAAAAIDAAATSLTQAGTARDTALDALITHVVALTGSVATPYQIHIDTINSTTATAAQKSAARYAIAAEVNTRATDTDTANDPSTALTALSTAYQTAKTDYTVKFRAKAQADVDHYNFHVARRDALKALADYTAATNHILGLETSTARVKLGNLSRALRGADENQLGTADHDKPIAILDVSLDLHSITASAATSIDTHTAKLTSLNAVIAENNRLIERNKAAITVQGRHIYDLYQRSKDAANGIAAAYALAGVPQIPGRLNLTISAGEFDGEEALGVSVHGQLGSRAAFSGAVVRSGNKNGLAAGITIRL